MYFSGSETTALHDVIITVMCAIVAAAVMEFACKHCKHLPTRAQAWIPGWMRRL